MAKKSTKVGVGALMISLNFPMKQSYAIELVWNVTKDTKKARSDPGLFNQFGEILLFGVSSYASTASANKWNGVVIGISNGNRISLVVDATNSRKRNLT